MPSVDVVIPNYNYGRYLRECVESVLSQNIEKLRVLIIDNASTDNSAEIARDLAFSDRRVEIDVRGKNLGHHASFNQGIDWAASEYFLILGADDGLTPGALLRATSVMDQHPDVHLTCGKVVRISADSHITKLNNYKNMWEIVDGRAQLEKFCSTGWNSVHGPSAVVRTDVQKKIGYYRKELNNTDDFEMWMRFACYGRVAETTAVQAFARYGGPTRSANVSWRLQYEAAFNSFFENEGSNLPNSSQLRSRWRRTLGGHAYWSVAAQLCKGEIYEAVDLLKLVYRLSPTMLLAPPIGQLASRVRERKARSHA
jgi:glycosyltransferase involved in cell wall biosynthesis